MGNEGEKKFIDAFSQIKIVNYIVFLERKMSWVMAHIKSIMSKFENISIASATMCLRSTYLFFF